MIHANLSQVCGRQITSTQKKVSSFTMYTVIKNCDFADDNDKNYAELSKNP